MGQEIGGWEPIRPKRAAVKVDFYLVGTEEGPSDEIENALSVIEGRASVAIRAVEAGDWPISEEHKAHLAEFLSLQRVRSTGFRESVNRSTNEIADRAYYLQEMARFGRAFATFHKRPCLDRRQRPAEGQLGAVVNLVGEQDSREHLSSSTGEPLCYR